MWEQQLNSMLESGHTDPETAADLGVAYAAETGDTSLVTCPSFPIFMQFWFGRSIRRQSLSQSKSNWTSRSRSMSQSRRGFWTRSWSRREIGNVAKSRSLFGMPLKGW
jgi:hypothetical protein